MESEYTMFPFVSAITSARLAVITFFIFVLVIAVRMVVFSRSLTLHKAPTTIIFAYIACSFANVIFTTFLYWYWALPLCLVISVIYAYTTAREVREADSEERMGIWGLNKDIRKIRAELFSDMTVEKQLEYAKGIKETDFSKPMFIIITMAVPVLAILIFYFMNIDYLFFPVLIS